MGGIGLFLDLHSRRVAAWPPFTPFRGREKVPFWANAGFARLAVSIGGAAPMDFVRSASALPARAPTAAGPQLYGIFFLEHRAAGVPRGQPFGSRCFLLCTASENDAIWVMGEREREGKAREGKREVCCEFGAAFPSKEARLTSAGDSPGRRIPRRPTCSCRTGRPPPRRSAPCGPDMTRRPAPPAAS